MNNVLDVFAEARSRFTLIGIIGMDSSGKSDFFEIVRREKLMAATQVDSATRLLVHMVNEENNKEIIKKFSEYGFNDVIDSNGKAFWNDEILSRIWQTSINDPKFSEDIHELVFPKVMELIAERLTGILTALPGTRKSSNIPIFMDLPLTKNNYKDYVDILISIVRPKVYDEDAWYMSSKISQEDFRYLYQLSPYFLSMDEVKKYLENRDKLWESMNIVPDILIENMGTRDEFMLKTIDCVMQFKRNISI